jgi:hypothetical protein
MLAEAAPGRFARYEPISFWHAAIFRDVQGTGAGRVGAHRDQAGMKLGAGDAAGVLDVASIR